ncbi:ADP-ribosylglycohydrolase family protein [Streptomyces violaceoruber]|uniref:ADP-ribosylglycohydrolase family protein n=1 Tax=Streptomyces violaceoruber TaxID=1935 RepID=UPI003B22096B
MRDGGSYADGMTQRTSADRGERVAGAVVGSAVGDALGAPLDVLTGGEPWDRAAALHFQVNGRAAGNGSLMLAATSAVYFARSGRTTTMAAAVDVGGDTDTVAAVTGGLAGAVYGIGAVPARWTEPLHVPLPGWAGRRLDTADLTALAERLDAEGPRPV